MDDHSAPYQGYVEKLEIDSASKNITKTVGEINDENTGGAEIKVLIGSNDSLQNVPLQFKVNNGSQELTGNYAPDAEDTDIMFSEFGMMLTVSNLWNEQLESGVGSISIAKIGNIAAGTYNFTVTAPTADNQSVSDTFTLTVTDGEENKPQPPAEKSLTGISITTPPTKKAYTVGDTFDPTGMSDEQKKELRLYGIVFFLLAAIDVCHITVGAMFYLEYRTDRALMIAMMAYKAVIVLIKLYLGEKILRRVRNAKSSGIRLQIMKAMLIAFVISLLMDCYCLLTGDIVYGLIEVCNSGTAFIPLLGCWNAVTNKNA